MNPPEPLTGTHLARVPCTDCGEKVLATPEQAETARCSGCWHNYVNNLLDPF